ncbi:Ribosomal protein lysine methyltransferase [Friedmanniomyces endolithicus]|nr:Ribosomal protein lysine methyltransferase [Friedmanniomyces endolithicus]KAK0943614.1 Ribosomal protein lysine methyltransferase [Friedmanniomyces endolithicus]KAK0982561.1 Ribosomal protein lysine methyltransferase [Friedmanniomyces endolithicus]KAK1005707.1 Ribosomal protein lysine methyltransferase [Friedmanniomyces endolithicus]
MDTFLAILGDEIGDAYEETFELFTHAAALPSLGMVDPVATSIELSIAGRDFLITQSPGLLHSKQKHGTTGAAVWRTSVKVAEWLASPKNVFFTHGIIDGDSNVLELGAGTSGIIASTLAPSVGHVVATDQQHMLKLLRANLDENAKGPLAKGKSHERRKVLKDTQRTPVVTTLALDWEEDDVTKHLGSHGLGSGVDLVLACDCIYNYALIAPFVQTCADVCGLRSSSIEIATNDRPPTVCLIAQQLRQSDVFEQWLEMFLRSFRVWRIPDDMYSEGLREGKGFALHIGVLR